jgi:hypothetical protein
LQIQGSFYAIKTPFLIFFEYINRVSLDAPIVVLAWQALISSELNVEITIPQRLVFFFSVWLAYSADRYLECFGQKSGKRLFKRHLYFYEHRVFFIIVWFSVLIISFYLTCLNFTIIQIVYCLALFLLVIANQTLSFYELKYIAKVLPKSQRTSILLTLGCMYLPLIFSRELKFEICIWTFFLLYLFWINCVLNNFWENFNTYPNQINFNLFQNNNYNLLNVTLQFLSLLIGIYVFYIEYNFNFFFFSVVNTSLIVLYLYKSKLKFEYKRIYIDQFYWIVPSSYLLLYNVFDF